MSLLGLVRSGRVDVDLRPAGCTSRLVVGGVVPGDGLVGRQRDVAETVRAAVAVVAGARCGRDVLLDAVAAAGVAHHGAPGWTSPSGHAHLPTPETMKDPVLLTPRKLGASLWTGPFHRQPSERGF